jgi:hypothetical protein
MEQTQLPQVNRESDRFEKFKQIFLEKPIEVQIDLIAEFISGLKIKYHQLFFKRLGPTGILNERWFLQFLTRRLEVKKDKKY